MKRQWSEPALVCVARGSAEESVLSMCKHASNGSSPGDGFAGCFTSTPCDYCSFFTPS